MQAHLLDACNQAAEAARCELPYPHRTPPPARSSEKFGVDYLMESCTIAATTVDLTSAVPVSAPSKLPTAAASFIGDVRSNHAFPHPIGMPGTLKQHLDVHVHCIPPTMNLQCYL